MENNRPNPDELLKKIQSEAPEPAERKAQLKIFLGFSAGVGKTYRMLQEARARKASGVDVVIGIVETHNRKETEALLSGLETVPRKKADYSGITLDEMDIDAVLLRKPGLVLVDELAHSNIPGSRHEKRYQDVEELLKAGIDVYTTLNIQHIESLNDMVQQISGIRVKETVPDMVTGRADEVELVDLTPEKLLERLKEGKVYVPQKAEQAMRQFFRKGNLLALRELSLNYTAKHVDDDFRSYMEKHAIPGPWPVGSRLLVAVSASPTSQQLLRFTHRLAKDLDAEWFAAYVESPQQLRIDKKSRVLLDRNIRLAEELGARTVPLSGKDIADELLKFARSKNVTLILTGTPKRTRLEEYFKGTIVDELIDKSGPIHVLVMGEADYDKTANENYPSMMKADYRAYFYSLALVSAFAAGGWIMRAGLEPVNIGMLLLLPAIASGMLWGIRVGLFASLLSVGVFDFLFVPPYLTFRITDFRYMPSFFMFVLVSVTVSYLSKSIREESEISAHRERFVYSLYSFSREMIEARGREEILHRAVSHIAEAFECDVAILLPDNGNKIRVAAVNASGIELNEAEKAVALWVCGNGQPAGRSTKTLSASEWYFLPLKVQDETIGTMGLKGRQERKFLTPDQNKLLESFAGVVALAIRKQ